MITGARRTKVDLNISTIPGINRESDFRRYVVVYGIITDVPWIEDESNAFFADIDLMRKTVEDGLSKRGETIFHIPYRDSVWQINGTKLSFMNCAEDVFHKIRKFALYEIIAHDWRSLETIKKYLSHLVRFFSLYKETEPHAHFAFIHASEIISFFECCGIALSSKCNILSTLIKFYGFLKLNYVKERFPVDIERLQACRKELGRLYQKEKKSKRVPTIPDQLFYLLHFRLMELIRDPMTPFDDAVTACLVIIHMWTGLRPKEIRGLRRRCLVEREEQGLKLFFYEYVSPKNKNRVQSVLLFQAALEAVKKLETLQTQREDLLKTDYLVSFQNHIINEPESYEAVSKAYNSLLIKYMFRELCTPNNDLGKIKQNKQVIYRPCLYSYRVHLCTYLIDHGYDERWVEAHLGHLSQTIRGRYYRMKEWHRNNIKQEIASIMPETDTIVKQMTNKLIATRPVGKTVIYSTLEERLIKLIQK